MRCMRIAATQVEALTVTLRAALKAHELARLAARVRRHDPATSGQAPDTGRPLDESSLINLQHFCVISEARNRDLVRVLMIRGVIKEA